MESGAASVHIPILLEPIVAAMREAFEDQASPAVLVDCTLGGGGHARAFLEMLAPHHRVLAFDQDGEAIARAREELSVDVKGGRLVLHHGPFSDLSPELLNAHGLGGLPVRGLLADLGFSSDQLEDPTRGISFLQDGPIDMRLDRSRGYPAEHLLRTLPESKITDIIFQLGEERFSRRIARAIVEARSASNFPRSTLELASLVEKAVPPPARHGRIHAATRTFQALRIAVNEELDELDRLLSHGILNLSVAGRVAIISFHSLEDRRVKDCFRDRSRWRPLSKKPLEADDEELQRNPRSRSAKLRIAERIG